MIKNLHLTDRLADALGEIDAVISEARRAGVEAISLRDGLTLNAYEQALREAASVLAAMSSAVAVEQTGLAFPGDEHLGDVPAEPEQSAKLWSFAVESDERRTPVVVCAPTGRVGSDGRDFLACGSIANPAGFCCEHGGFVRPQPQAEPLTEDEVDEQVVDAAVRAATKPYSYQAKKFGDRKYGIVRTLPGVSGWEPIPVLGTYLKRLRDADALAALLEAEYYRTGQTTPETEREFFRSIGENR